MFLNHKNKNNKINVHYLFIQCNLTISRLVKAKQLSIKQFYCIVFMINQRNDKTFLFKGGLQPLQLNPTPGSASVEYKYNVCYICLFSGQLKGAD